MLCPVNFFIILNASLTFHLVSGARIQTHDLSVTSLLSSLGFIYLDEVAWSLGCLPLIFSTRPEGTKSFERYNLNLRVRNGIVFKAIIFKLNCYQSGIHDDRCKESHVDHAHVELTENEITVLIFDEGFTFEIAGNVFHVLEKNFVGRIELCLLIRRKFFNLLFGSFVPLFSGRVSEQLGRGSVVVIDRLQARVVFPGDDLVPLAKVLEGVLISPERFHTGFAPVCYDEWITEIQFEENCQSFETKKKVKKVI